MKKHGILPATWSIPQEIQRRLGDSAGRQRVIAEDGHTLIVLHKAPGKDDSTREGLFLWREPNGDWHNSERGAGLTALAEHLEHLEKIENRLDEDYEAANEANDYFALLESLAPLQRSVNNMCRTLQEARDLVGEELINYRDKGEELLRNFELLNVDSKNALDYAVARKAEEQSELQRQALVVGHRLNIIMALFLPITAVASLLGMNIQHGLESSPPWLFVLIVGICGFMGVLMRIWVNRKSPS